MVSTSLKYRYKIKRKRGQEASGMMHSLEGLKHFAVEDGDEITIKVTEK
jgi:hypothetical protein